MRKVTQEVVSAFMQGKACRSSNTQTDGQSLWLFFNKIAEHRHDGLYITDSGWVTKTTGDRLRALPDIILQRTTIGGESTWVLNSKLWDGGWIKVNDNPPPTVDESVVGSMFDMARRWVQTSGYRGYMQPVYAVCGANDTGTFSDSPCPTHVAQAELNAIELALKAAKIPYKVDTCETSNVFCIHHYLVVPPKFVDKGRELVDNHMSAVNTRLLYRVDAI